MCQQAVINPRLDTTGIDQQKFVAAPFTITKNAIAGHARRVLHDGKALAGQFIENRRLAHVGTTNDSNDRFCHVHLSLIRSSLDSSNTLVRT